MDTITLTLSTNHVVKLKKSLTYRAERAITAALMGDTPLKFSSSGSSVSDQELEVRYANVQSYQDEALRHLILEVVNPDKSIASDPFEAVMELPSEVAGEVMAKVSEITDHKKKEVTGS